MVRKIGVGGFETTDRMRELVGQVLDTGRLSYGPLSQKFETYFARLHQCNYAVLSNSGTSSLQVALQALKEMRGWADGDEVLVPAVTFVATVNIILHNNMVPVLVDVDPVYYGMDPALIEDAITDKTRAIIPVHLFGQPCDLPNITRLAGIHGLKVIEDSCECMFSHIEDRSVGAWGDIGCFSTYVAHLITSGVGGLGTTRDPDIEMKMRSLVNHGRHFSYMSIDDDDNLDEFDLGQMLVNRFNFVSVGHSFRVTEFESAIALAQLETWKENIGARVVNGHYLTVNLEKLSQIQTPTIRPNGFHSFMMYPVLVRDNRDKWPLCFFLESRGIETREMMRIVDQPAYAKLDLWDPADFPVAQMIDRSGFYVGCHDGLTSEDMDYILQSFYDYFSKGQRE